MVRYLDIDFREKLEIADIFWEYISKTYSNGTSGFPVGMAFWQKQIEKVDEDYNILGHLTKEGKWSRSIFDILYKSRNIFFRSDEKMGKVYAYDLVL
jgi:hypothetical protein